MKNFLLITIFLLLSFTTTKAAITPQQAKAMAAAHFNRHVGISGKSPAMIYNIKETEYKFKDNNNKAFYIFNNGKDDGFAIIGNDDNAQIIGYADNGTFSVDGMPDNIKAWLETYETNNEINSGLLLKSTNTKAAYTVISPLLSRITFTQKSPYNDLCPMVDESTRSAAGCMATSMAQVMKYYNYPQSGKGIVEYTTTTHKFKIKEDLSSYTFNWDNILPFYDNTSTEEQKSEAARLNYAVGVSAKMNYSYSSGASDLNCAMALVENWEYAKSTQYVKRGNVSEEEWIRIIKNELNNRRPVLYSGRNQSGHSFICDGYDSNDYFHFNWGWGGYCNGYYRLNDLDPSGYTQTGDLGSSGYIDYQAAIIGISPLDKEINATAYNSVSMLNCSLSYKQNIFNRNQDVPVIASVLNEGLYEREFFIGGKLTSYNDNSVIYMPITDTHILKSRYYFKDRCYNISIPKNADAGKYKLELYCITENGKDTVTIRANRGYQNFLNIAVTEDKINILDEVEEPSVILTEVVCNTNIYKGKRAQINLSLKNEKSDDFNSYISVFLKNLSTGSTIEIDRKLIFLSGYEERSIILYSHIDETLSEEEHEIIVCYDKTNTLQSDNNYKMLPEDYNSQIVDIYYTQEERSAILTGYGTAECDNKGGINISFPVKAVNTDYFGYFNIAIYTTNLLFVESFSPCPYLIEKGMTEDISMKGEFNLPAGKYKAVIFCSETKGNYKQMKETRYSIVNLDIPEQQWNSLDSPVKDKSYATKFIIDNTLYLRQGDDVYDLSGRKVPLNK